MSDEIEVTDEMIEAGYAALAAACITEHLLDADRLTVAEIYRAMEAARPKPAPLRTGLRWST